MVVGLGHFETGDRYLNAEPCGHSSDHQRANSPTAGMPKTLGDGGLAGTKTGMMSLENEGILTVARESAAAAPDVWHGLAA